MSTLNFLDKTISFFAPGAGLRRAQKRTALDIIAKRGYEGARRDRRTKGWNVNEFEDTQNLSEIRTLKERSRDLYKNNPYSFRGHNSIANNTTGIGIVPAIRNEGLKKIWNAWANDISVDFDGIQTFAGIQNLAMRTMSMHGEVLILRIATVDKDNVPLQLKVITSKFLDSSKDIENRDDGGYVRGGIEFDRRGRRVGYWLFDTDPSLNFQTKSTRWKESDVIHLFFQDEPGQSRGVPFGTSSMMKLRDFDDYEDAQLMRQKIAACFSVFITKTDADLTGSNLNADEDDERLERVEPGIIEHLEPGKQVTFASPPPAENYGEYSRNVLTAVSSGYGMSYESMTGDLSNVNYSSGRMGFLEYQRMIETWQSLIIIPRLCQRVWKWFLDSALMSGLLQGNQPYQMQWTVPGRKMIDPVKEVQGLLNQVRAGFMSWQEAVRQLGYSPEDILVEMTTAKEQFDAAGLQPQSDPRYDAQKLAKDQNNATGDSTDTDA